MGAEAIYFCFSGRVAEAITRAQGSPLALLRLLDCSWKQVVHRVVGELPGGDPVELAALMYATSHGAVDLALSGHTEESKGLGDPLALVRLLLDSLRTS